MVKERITKTLSNQEIQSLLKVLQDIGKKTMVDQFKTTLLDKLPLEVRKNKEYLVRFLLLTAILDQQAESPSAREAAFYILKTFGKDLFENPLTVLYEFNKLIPLTEIYKISPAIGRVTPRFAWITLRVGGFLIFQLQLNHQKRTLSEELGNCKSPLTAYEYIQNSMIIKSLLREKACRLFISWIGHPDLEVNVSDGKWKKSKFLMPVDGHVGKVFTRTGMLSSIYRESERKEIIEALKMRQPIQNLVSGRGLDVNEIDYASFVIGYWCCSDQTQNISCDECNKINICEIRTKINCKGSCPLTQYCKKNTQWRAY